MTALRDTKRIICWTPWK